MDVTEFTTFGQLVGGLLGLINLLIPAIFGIVFLVVVWRIIDAWVINGADESKRAEGRQLVLIAIIVLVLMISTWGIVALIRSSLSLS